jgi:hypothetical protein
MQIWPNTIANKSRLDIIKANSISNKLDTFRDSFTLIYALSIPWIRWIRLTKVI